MPKVTDPLILFMRKVQKTDTCWLWIGHRQEYGYGKFRWQGEAVQAHRVSWELHRGHIPKGVQICHKCDNPPCVNPDHLFLGTQSDNMQDCKRKGRFHPPPTGKGSAHNQAKLSDADVFHIRRSYRSGVPARSLASRYKLTRAYIYKVISGATWQHLSDEEKTSANSKL